MTKFRIAILGYNGCMGTQLFGMADIFHIAADVAHSSLVQVELIALGAGNACLGGEVQVALKRPRGRYDLVIVPGMAVTREVNWAQRLDGLRVEVAFIRRAFARGARIASMCVGAFLLGEAGVLDGRKATTAWLFAKQFAERYPTATVEPDRLLIEDAGITTTGAVSAVFDLALHLTRHIFGAQAAAGVAHAALLPKPRTSQAPFIDRRMLHAPVSSFAQSLDQWYRRHLREPFHLERAAKAFHVSTRTFLQESRQKRATPRSHCSSAYVSNKRNSF